MIYNTGSKLRAPTTASLPDSQRIPSTARSLIRSFSRLSRNSLIKLVLEWLEPDNQPLCAPYLSSNRSHIEETEEDYLYQSSETLEELREIYTGLLKYRGTKRDVIDRILEGDWRRGISLRQLAMLDYKCLEENETCLRWTALKLVEHTLKTGKTVDEEVGNKKMKAAFPAFRASSFVQCLQREIAPLLKAHYHIHRLQSHNLTVLRLFICDSPYTNVPTATQRTFTDLSRTVFIAFPDSCPFIYISVSGTQMDGSAGRSANRSGLADIATLKRLVVGAVPKALSRPHQRIALQTTSLSARSLSTMIALRGNSRNNAANGAFSIFADATPEACPIAAVQKRPSDMPPEYDAQEKDLLSPTGVLKRSDLSSRKRRRTVLSPRDSNSSLVSDTEDQEINLSKKRRIQAQIRFGTTGITSGTANLTTKETPNETTSISKQNAGGIDRLQIRLEEPLSLPSSSDDQLLPSPSSDSSTPAGEEPTKMTLTFHGTNVFAGLRLLCEKGLIDPKRMPSWMTGEEGVSSGVVRGGRMVDGKGGGA